MTGEYEARHEQAWRAATERVGTALETFVLRLIEEYFGTVTYERYGVASGLDTSARRVTVRLNPPTGTTAGTPQGQTVTAAYGRPTWSAGAIVNKPVRVWERIERRLVGLRLVPQTTTYTVDDVTG